ncbi:MAG: TonB-dependent receptor [Bacteroidales bacterium]|nr:TonB-dependent receptor [Bacteroidales bacterium]
MLLYNLCSVLLSGSILSDTCDVHPLHEVEVVQQPQFREVLSGQKLDGARLEQLSVLSVADALHHFAGLQVRDYGGIGGIKTINVRSMGSQHTGIFYDGIELGNAQNGQIDLGQFSMENIESVNVYQGQRSAIFQTASDLGHASTVYLRTRVPIFNTGEKTHLRLKTQYGSSDLVRLSGLWEQRLNSRLVLSALAEGLTASGHYPFRYRRLNYDGSVAYDTTATRQNGDVQSFRAEVNLIGQQEQGHWKIKVYTFQSQRGIPGAIVNNVWHRGERQGDHNSFIQGLWQRDVNPHYSMRFQGKYAYYATHYENRDTTQYMADNLFRQQEAYASTSHVWQLLPGWSLSTSYDFRFNALDADLPLFQTTYRQQHLAAIATAIHTDHFRAQGSLLQTWSFDHGRRYHSPSYRQCSPALFALWQANAVFALHGFAKRSFRLPTFNDLYYTDLGNALLRPETATQYNVGIHVRPRLSSQHTLSLRADAYYNRVKDKIVAYPKGQQFRWTMLNLGRVDIQGMDCLLDYEGTWSDFQYNLTAQYTWQEAIDVTSSSDSFYRDQIPYVPHHSGSFSAGIGYRNRYSLAYSFTYVGERYCQQENIRFNHLEPWYTSDINLQYRHEKWRVTAEVLNLLNQQYDVIVNYPMPGINFRLSLCAQF